MTVNATGWSTTPGNNTTIDSISTAENVMTVAAVNNAIRSLMAGTKEALDLMMGAKTTAGSSNAYTLTTGLGLASYAAGQGGMFKASFTNTGSATLNVDSIGAKTFNKPDAVSALTTLAAGDIVSGGIYAWAYQASDDKIILLNPSTATVTLDADLVAIAALAGTGGVLAKTAANTWALRTLTGTSNEVSVADGDGVAANPTLSLPSTLALRGKAVQVQDSNFTISDDGDATKLLAFQLSGVTTGTTRTVTIPDKSGTMAMTSDIVAAGYTVIANSQPTSDAGTLSVTGLSSYTFIKIHGFFEITSGTGIALAFRVSAGTFRDLGTVLDVSGGSPNQLIAFNIEVSNVKNSGEKIITTSFASASATTLDSSNAVNTVSNTPTQNIYFASWDEIWDEVRITATGGTIAGTTSDQRGRVLVYGA